jgi:hypothetical protein
MNIIHTLQKYNFAGTPTDVTFIAPPANTLPYSYFSFTVPEGYVGIENQGFTLFLAGQTLAFTFRIGTAATDISVGMLGTDWVASLMHDLMQHPVISLYCTVHRMTASRIELRSAVLSDFAVVALNSPISVVKWNYIAYSRRIAVVHCTIRDTIVPSELSILGNQAQLGLMEMVFCEPLVPNPAATIAVQPPVSLQIRYGAKQNGITERLKTTDAYYFIAGSGDSKKLNPARQSNIYIVALHDYEDHPVYVHHRQPNWIYLFCARHIGSTFPYDPSNAVIQFRCVFSDGTMYRVVIDEEVNFSLLEGNVYAFPCGLEQMYPLDLIRQHTPQGQVIVQYWFELVALNRLATYFSQGFHVEQRFLHPLDQTTFLCYDNGCGGFQTAFFSGTVQRTVQSERNGYRNHKGEPYTQTTAQIETWGTSTGYWDDENQLKRYQRIIGSPKTFIVDWDVKTVDDIELHPVSVKTDSVGLPADVFQSNAFSIQLERLI